MTGLFIAWAPHNRRSEQLAAALGLQLHLIHRLRYRAPLYAPVKYPVLMAETWRLLARARPQVVFVQNPPPLLPLLVLAFAARHPLRLVVDHHTAAFSRAWAWLGRLRPWVVRQAVVNLVTNEHWQEAIRVWGGKALILDDVPAEFPAGKRYPLPIGANVAMVSSFAPDEPLAIMPDVARFLPDVHFHVTGDKRRAPTDLLRAAPPNLRFTGFLPDERYFGLLRAVDAVLVLTTRDHTNQRGGCEAVWLGQPLVVSDWPVLRRAFHGGAVHVPNTAEGVAAGVREALARRDDLATGMYRLQTERRARWVEVSAQMRKIEPCERITV
jgi:glycosyltransferase involved in cell wall biosynthesis